jgi:hypothetical protein
MTEQLVLLEREALFAWTSARRAKEAADHLVREKRAALVVLQSTVKKQPKRSIWRRRKTDETRVQIRTLQMELVQAQTLRQLWEQVEVKAREAVLQTPTTQASCSL